MSTRMIGVVAIIVIFGVWAFIHNTPWRWMSADSRLGFMERRIANIPSEFIRRSARFAQAWEHFKLCSRTKTCDSEPILVWRDNAVARQWPTIFDRLTIREDWGERRDTQESRDAFFKALKAEGRARLRNKCLPIIEFRNPGGRPYYAVTGYLCEKVKTSSRK